MVLDTRGADYHRVVASARFARGIEATGIRFAVDELQRVADRNVGEQLAPASTVGGDRESLAQRKPKVMAALAADIEVAFDFLMKRDLFAARALDPNVFCDRLRPLSRLQLLTRSAIVHPSLARSGGVGCRPRRFHRTLHRSYQFADVINEIRASRYLLRSVERSRCQRPPHRRNAPLVAACSGVEIPKPTPIGKSVTSRRLVTCSSMPDASAVRAPVTPVTET